MVNALYPRTISIRRPLPNTNVGEVTYGGTSPTNEKIIVSGIPAHIQVDNRTNEKPEGLASSAGEPLYKVIYRTKKIGLIRYLDIVVDDQGNRYQVAAVSEQTLSTTLRCRLLKAS